MICPLPGMKRSGAEPKRLPSIIPYGLLFLPAYYTQHAYPFQSLAHLRPCIISGRQGHINMRLLHVGSRAQEGCQNHDGFCMTLLFNMVFWAPTLCLYLCRPCPCSLMTWSSWQFQPRCRQEALGMTLFLTSYLDPKSR